MGSTCSSAQKKAGKNEEERRASMLSTDSIPYGGSPKGERKTSNNRPMAGPPEPPAATVVHSQAINSKGPTAAETPPSTAAPSTATPNSANAPPSKGPPGSSPSHSESGIPDLTQFPEIILPLLMGRWNEGIAPLTLKEITLYVGGNYSGPLRLSMFQKVYPNLRALCAGKGFDLLVVDTEKSRSIFGPHYGRKGGTLATLNSCAPLLILLLMSEGSESSFLPPLEIGQEDFEAALQRLDDENADLLRQSYLRQGSCFKLRAEIKTPEHCMALLEALKEGLTNKETYLQSELEKELQCILGSDCSLPKRTLWVQLPATPSGDLPDEPTLPQMKTRLQELIPDSQRHLLPASGLPAAPEMLAIELKKLLDVTLDEEFTQLCKMPYKGIEDPLYEELHCQAMLCRSFWTIPMLHREAEIAQVQSYLQQGRNQGGPLVLHAPRGVGRSRLVAAVGQQASNWLSTATPLCLSLLPQGPSLRSTSEQCCALYGVHPSHAFQSPGEEHPLKALLGRSNPQRPLALVLDDFAPPRSKPLLKLLAGSLSPHLRILLTVETGSKAHTELQNLLEDTSCFVALNPLTPEQALDIVEAAAFPVESESLRSQILESLKTDATPAYTQLIAHWLRATESSDLPPDRDAVVQSLIENSGSFGARVLTLLACVRQGLSTLELLDLIEPENLSLLSYWQFLAIRTNLGPLLTITVDKRHTMFKLNPCYSEDVFRQLEGDKIKLCKEELKTYFNRAECGVYRKVIEFPFLNDPANPSFKNKFLLDADYLSIRAMHSNPAVILDDIQRVVDARDGKEDLELAVLREVLQKCSYALRYDGSQLLCQLYRHLLHHPSLKACPSLQKLLNVAARPQKPSLLPIRVLCKSPTHEAEPSHLQQPPQVLHTMQGYIKYMLSLSPHAGQVTVWDVFAQDAVRTLMGVFEPKDAKMVDESRCLLLCNRELKVYDLDEGCLKLKLKGVMNQHMAYFGLHGSSYVVALSRNRMYVNMMNLQTGDLETTFKVGEDRFLNSLLVSGNGKICVCGDETQKPFPLLVWDLDNRKLLYDLRIPHHEFLTHLSAISHDGHYVVCVCKELDDGSPNFIIVYDLQSGTLFKKWKPESDSCSIAISAPHGVINGINNSLVLVWDLVTGARKFNFTGHSAPVDQIKMDAEGSRCLTFDSSGKDRSIRLWDLAVGHCLAVLTPDHALVCAQLTLDGGAVVMGFKGSAEIVTYVLCHQHTVQEAIAEASDFGDAQRRGLTSDVSKQG